MGLLDYSPKNTEKISPVSEYQYKTNKIVDKQNEEDFEDHHFEEVINKVIFYYLVYMLS